jgi:hypothetical protein
MIPRPGRRRPSRKLRQSPRVGRGPPRSPALVAGSPTSPSRRRPSKETAAFRAAERPPAPTAQGSGAAMPHGDDLSVAITHGGAIRLRAAALGPAADAQRSRFLCRALACRDVEAIDVDTAAGEAVLQLADPAATGRDTSASLISTIAGNPWEEDRPRPGKLFRGLPPSRPGQRSPLCRAAFDLAGGSVPAPG